MDHRRWPRLLPVSATALALGACSQGTKPAPHWQVIAYDGASARWTLERRTDEFSHRKRRTTVHCMSYRWGSRQPTDTCNLAVGDMYVEPWESFRINANRSEAVKYAVIDFISSEALSVTSGLGGDRVLQMFVVDRDELE